MIRAGWSAWQGNEYLAQGWELAGESAGGRSAATRAEQKQGGWGGSAPFPGWCAGCAVGVGGVEQGGERERVAAACHHPHEPFAVTAFATTSLIKARGLIITPALSV